MVPRHFANRARRHHISETEEKIELKVEEAVQQVVSFIAMPVTYILNKHRPDSPDKD
jgi:hypothetical protein